MGMPVEKEMEAWINNGRPQLLLSYYRTVELLTDPFL